MKPKALLIAIFLILTTNAFSVSAQEFATVSPTALNLTLAQGESTVEQVSLTIHPFCVRPIEVDVDASSVGALLANLTGVLLNGCGGDTSTFDISIMGTGLAQNYDLQFVDAEFGGVLASIPVTITPPVAQPCFIELSLRMQDRALSIGLGLNTLEPGDFNLFISLFNQTYSLLKAPVPLPVIDPIQFFAPTIAAFPDLGTIGILATITTAQDGIRCSAWQTIDTGSAP
ncbi:MAG: hypothetical protein OER87_13235 [Gammaproteobacteria bacterium]|nr:hypothetical protein [Gammaproteobacteria bacterium]